MKSVLIFTLLLVLFLKKVMADGLPEKIFVSSKNAEQLGFEFTLDKEQGSPKIWVVTLKFPLKVRDGWPVRRVQTYLMDKNGVELSSTSLDHIVSSSSPSLLFHFQPEMYDMAVVVQYSCPDGGDYGCAEAYTIQSMKSYFTN